MKVFIGGSKNVSSLNSEIYSRLDRVMEVGETVLIGDCYGADKLVQEYFQKCNYNNIVVYVSGDKVRNNVGKWPVVNVPVPEDNVGYDFYKMKDIAMVDVADHGIMIWNGHSSSKGTLNNIVWLEERKKLVEVICLRQNVKNR